MRSGRVILKMADMLACCWQWPSREKEMFNKEEKGIIAEPKSFNRVETNIQVEVWFLIRAERVGPL